MDSFEAPSTPTTTLLSSMPAPATPETPAQEDVQSEKGDKSIKKKVGSLTIGNAWIICGRVLKAVQSNENPLILHMYGMHWYSSKPGGLH